MPNKLLLVFNKIRNMYLPQGAFILSTLTFLSYLLGLIRDRMFARTFGAAGTLDAYNAPFILPELILDVLVAGALGAAFIPIFTGVEEKDKKEAALFARTVITLAVLTMFIASILIIVFAPYTVNIIVPGFDATHKTLFIKLLRLLALAPIIFSASIAIGELLVVKRRFLAYGLAPVLYNFGIIAGTFFLGGTFGIFGVAIGTLFGALLHLAIRLIDILMSGFIPVPALKVKTKEFLSFFWLMLPKMAGHPVEPLTFLFFTAAASNFGQGSVTTINFARNFQSVPVALIGIAFAIASFPGLARAFAEKDRWLFAKIFKGTALGILALTIPAAIIIYLFNTLIIKTFLGGGAFDEKAVLDTAMILGFFALSVPLESLSHLLARAFYATKNTAWPVGASFLALIITVLTANYLSPQMGIASIPLAFAAGNAAKIGLLGMLLPARIRKITK